MERKKIHRANTIASVIAIATALVLVLFKFAVALLSGSIAILASAVDSLLDVMITGVNFFTIRAAAKPPDADHRFGHGKFEAFASLVQGIFIVFSGGYLAFESVRRFVEPAILSHELWGLVVMIFATIVSILLVWYLRHVAQQTGSLVIKAEITNFSADILANLAVVFGLIIVKISGWIILDAVISLIIAAIILHSAWTLLYESYQVLTDHELPDDIRHKIISIIEQTTRQQTSGWGELRTRRAGSQIHIDFHLSFTDDILLKKAHGIGDSIETQILEQFPMASVLIHFDPHPDNA